MTRARSFVGGLLAMLALVACLGLPALRLLHEAHHHRAGAHGEAGVTVATAGLDQGPCLICQLLSAAPGQAIEPVVSGFIDPITSPVSLSAPPIGWTYVPGLSRQPPARGPPSSSLS